jgi:cytochrome c-type biogenesis protein CcmH
MRMTAKTVNVLSLRGIALFALLALALSVCALAVDITVLPNEELQQRYEGLTRQLRCVKCQNNNIADSPAGLAADLRVQVKEQLLAGKSDKEILAYMAQRYGNYILFTPPMEKSTAWIWILPGVAALAGLVIGIRIVRRRASLVDDGPVEGDEATR